MASLLGNEQGLRLNSGSRRSGEGMVEKRKGRERERVEREKRVGAGARPVCTQQRMMCRWNTKRRRAR